MKLETARKSIGKAVKFKKSYQESGCYCREVEDVLKRALSITIKGIDSDNDVEVYFHNTDGSVLKYGAVKVHYAIEPKHLKLVK